MIDLFRRDTRDAPLVVNGRRAKCPMVDVDVRPTDLAVRLDREQADQKVFVFGRHLSEILGRDLVVELRHDASQRCEY